MQARENKGTHGSGITSDEITAAFLADHSYHPEEKLPKECEGWKKAVVGNNASSTISENELSATIYVNEKNEYTVGFRGTAGFLNLVKHDRSIAFGSIHPECEDFVKKVLKQIPKSSKVQFVGHSLGASMATYASLSSGHPAIVIDSPGVGENISKRFRNKDWGKITAIQASPNLVNIINRDQVEIKVLNMPGYDRQQQVMDRNPSSTLGFMLFNINDYHDRKNIIKAMQSTHWFDEMHKGLVKQYGKEEANKKLNHMGDAILQSIQPDNAIRQSSKIKLDEFLEMKHDYGKNFVSSLEKIGTKGLERKEHKEIPDNSFRHSINGLVENLQTVIKPFGDISQVCYQLGALTGKRDLQKIGIAASNLQQIGSALPSLVSAFSSGAPLMAINPAFAILTAGAGIIGMFAKKRKASQARPDPHLEAMTQMTHAIISEVHNMWNAMDKEFALLHKENRELFKLMHNGFLHLESFLRGEVNFLSDKMDTLFNELQNSIERAQALILQGQQEIYLKEFRKATLDAKNIINNGLPTEKAEAVLGKLLGYTQNGGLLTRPLLNGVNLALTDASIPLHESVKKATRPREYTFAEENVAPLTGYLALTAKRIFAEEGCYDHSARIELESKVEEGSNIHEGRVLSLISSYLDNPFSGFDNKIVNPDLWMHGVLYFSILKNHFGEHVKNSSLNEVSLVSDTGHHLLSLIDGLRFSGMFNILFARYQEKLDRIIKLTNDSFARENQVVVEEAKSEIAVDINDIEKSLKLCGSKIPAFSLVDLDMQIQPVDFDYIISTHFRRYKPNLAWQDKNYNFGNYNLTTKLPDLGFTLILSHLGLGKLFFDYQIKIDSIKLDSSTPLGTADLAVYFSSNAEKADAKKIFQLKYDISKKGPSIDIANTDRFKVGRVNGNNADFLLGSYYNEVIKFWNTGTCACCSYEHVRIPHHRNNFNVADMMRLSSSLSERFTQTKLDYSSEYKDILMQAKDKLASKFLHHRKKAVNTLFDDRMKQHKEFQTYCDEIDSLRYLLISYGYLAGLSPEEMGLLNTLWKGEKVVEHFKSYRDDKAVNCDTPLPHTNLVPDLNHTKEVILRKTNNPLENKFQSVVESKVVSALMNLSILHSKEKYQFQAKEEAWIVLAKKLIEKYNNVIHNYWENVWLKEWFQKLPTKVQAKYEDCSNDFKKANGILDELTQELKQEQIDFDSVFENFETLNDICNEIQMKFQCINLNKVKNIKQYYFDPNLSSCKDKLIKLQELSTPLKSRLAI